MMSDYKRTMKLVGYANNSAGASQEQFGKTMDSLESKLNRLHNAWETFTTGIANASVIKFGVDLLTNLLTIINNVTKALDPFNTGITKTLVAILGFKVAKGIVNKAVRDIGGNLAKGMGKKGEETGKTFWQKFTSAYKKHKINPEQAEQIKKVKPISAMQSSTEDATKAATRYKRISKQYDEYSQSLQKIEALEKAGKTNTTEYTDAIAKKTRAIKFVTAAEGEEAGAQLKNMTAEEASKKAKENSAIASTIETGALTKEAIAEEANSMTKMRAVGTLLFGNKQKKLAAMVSLGLASAEEAETIATEGATGAQTALNAAIYSCPIGWIIAGIAALVGVVALLAAIIETDTEKQERLNDTAKKTAETFSDAQSKLSELTGAKDSLDSLVKELDDLTEGTDEWKQKLVEVNNEVLKLIEQYPELAQYVSNKNGRLTIETSGWNAVLDKQTEWVQLQASVNAAAQGASAGQNFKMSKVGQLYSADSSEKGIDYTNYNRQLALSVVNDLTSGTDAIKLSDEIKNNIVDAFSTEDMVEELTELKDATEANYDEYAKIANLTKEEVDQKKENNELSDDQVKLTLAANEYMSKIKDRMSNLSSVLGDVGDWTNFKKLTSRNSMGLGGMQTFLAEAQSEGIFKGIQNYSDLLTIDKERVEEQLKKYFQTIYHLSEEQLKEMGISIEGVATNLIDNAKILYDTFYDAEKNNLLEFITNRIQTLERSLNIDLDTTQVETYVKILSKISARGGDTKKFADNFEEFLSKLKKSPEKIKALFQQLNGLDWISGSDILNVLSQFSNALDTDVRQKLIDATNAEKDYGVVTKTEQNNLANNARSIREMAKGDQTSFDPKKDKETVDLIEGIKGQVGVKTWNKYFTKDSETGIITVSDLKSLDRLADILVDLRKGAENARVATENYNKQVKKSAKDAQEAQKIMNETTPSNISMQDFAKRLYSGSFDNEGQSYRGILTKGKNGDEFSTGYANVVEKYLPKKNDFLNVTGEIVQKAFSHFVDTANANPDSSLQGIFEKVTNIQNLNKTDTFKNLKVADFTALSEYITAFSSALQENSDLFNSLSDKDRNFFAQLIKNYSNNTETSTLSPEVIKFWLTGDKLGDYQVRDDRGEGASIEKRIKNLKEAGYLREKDVKALEKITNLEEKQEEIEKRVKKNRENELSAAEQNKINADKNKYSTAMSAKQIVSDKPENYLQQQSQLKVLNSIIQKHQDWKIELKKIQKEYNVTEENAKRILALKYEQRETTDNIVSILNNDKDNFASARKNTEAYNKTIMDLKSNFQKLFGDKISFKWVEDNLSTIQKLAKGGDEAKAAMQALANTSEAVVPQVKMVLSDAQSIAKQSIKALQKVKIDDKIYNPLKEAFGDVADYISGRKKDITNDFVNIKKAFKSLDGSKASMTVKAQTQDALAELIRVGMVEAFTTNNVDKFMDLYRLALDCGLAITGMGALVTTSYVDGNPSSSFRPGAKDFIGLFDVAAWVKNKKEEYIRPKSYAERLLSEFEQNVDVVPEGLSSNVQIDKSKDKSKSKNKTTPKKKTKEKSDWVNDWQLYYNLLKKIEVIERKRNSLEKELSYWTKSTSLRVKEMKKTRKEIEKTLQRTIKLNQQLLTQAKDEIIFLNHKAQTLDEKAKKANRVKNEKAEKKYKQKLEKYNKKLEEYNQNKKTDKNAKKPKKPKKPKKTKPLEIQKAIWYDPTTNTIHTNDKYIRSLNEKDYKKFSDIKSQYEELYGQITSAEDSINEATDAILELKDSIKNIDFQKELSHTIDILNHTFNMYDKKLKQLSRPENRTTKKEFKSFYSKREKAAAQEYEEQNARYATASQILNAYMNDKELKKYAKVNYKTGKITRKKGFYSLDQASRDKIEEKLDNITEQIKIRQEVEETRLDLEDAAYERMREVLDASNDFQRSVYDAVVKDREKQINTLETINSSIENASSKLVDSMQKSIQKIRQDRKNQKTEEELSDMQSKLSYLQADTSGANEVEILKLQKQLSEKQESYTDTLIDQKINELQDQNKEAAEQRKMQIEILKAQLDHDKQTGALWVDVANLLAKGINKDGQIKTNSNLYRKLAYAGETSSMNSYEKQNYWGSQNYGALMYSSESGVKKTYNDTISSMQPELTKKELKEQADNLIRDARGRIKEWISGATEYFKYDSKNNKLMQIEKVPKGTKAAYQVIWDAIMEEIRNIKSYKKWYKENSKSNVILTQMPSVYKKGGLVDNTGLQWLDGTKSNPELVLNAKDTQNFLALKDILSGVMRNTSSINNSNSNVNCEVQINVDSISNDYDVDKIAARIEYNIMQSAKYRNVNNLTMMR